MPRNQECDDEGGQERAQAEENVGEVRRTRLIPQATVRALEGIGHLSPLEAPGELADACAHLLDGL